MLTSKRVRFLPLWISLTLLLVSCDSLEEQEITIDFQFKFGGKYHACLGPENELKGLAFFVSQFSSIPAGQAPIPLTIRPGDGAQTDVALIRFDACSSSGASPSVTLSDVPSLEGVALNVGLPFEINHGNPAVQDSPLNVGSMFWTWRLGYKFIRLDMQDWSFHLGSGGCVSPSAVRSPDEPCEFPNLARVTLGALNLDANTLIFDLDHLLGNLADNHGVNCMDGFYRDSSCSSLTGRLGLVDGVCKDQCKGQQVFYLKP